MTLDDVLQNEDLRHREFPISRERIYLSHAGVAPLPRRVTEAIQNYAAASGTRDQEEAFTTSRLPRLRQLAARLLQGDPDEIAFVGPTTLSLNLVASGLPLRKGDNILIYLDDFPSNVYPWMALAERGIEVRMLNVRELGQIRTIDVIGQIDEDTRCVALASCHFITGFRIDLPGIGKALRERNIRFCVDGIQTMGAFPTTVEFVDCLAADAHKWLLGPSAAGILYVRKAFQEQLRPSVFGWHNVRCPNYVAQEKMVLRPDARRYECGTPNLLGLVGLEAALELLLEIGIDRIANELMRKRTWLIPALQEKGYSILAAGAPPAHASGIVSFHKPGVDLAGLHQKLAAAGIVAALRADRSGRQFIRFSPHFYNTDAELAHALSLL